MDSEPGRVLECTRGPSKTDVCLLSMWVCVHLTVSHLEPFLSVTALFYNVLY